tara:strand:- start:758 stop:961 length:204 start_codon:yes stop_codon:yes gene_type:complete
MEIKLKKGENVEKGIKKLKRKLLKEKTLDYAREKRYYEKPTRKKYKKERKAKYIQKLKSKQEREYWG